MVAGPSLAQMHDGSMHFLDEWMVRRRRGVVRGVARTLPGLAAAAFHAACAEKLRDLAACNTLAIQSCFANWLASDLWLCTGARAPTPRQQRRGHVKTRHRELQLHRDTCPERAMARARAFVLCALAAAPAHGIWPFGRRTTALAKKVRSLERDTLEFESNERILLEQLRQMRLTTGELRTTLRESIAESERVAAENAAAVAKLEGEVATLKTKLAAAEQRAAAAEASAAKVADAESALAAAKAEAALPPRRSWPRRRPS